MKNEFSAKRSNGRFTDYCSPSCIYGIKPILPPDGCEYAAGMPAFKSPSGKEFITFGYEIPDAGCPPKVIGR